MAYTVQKFAKLSGVSVRTLHYYDEIGLLKPAYHGENGYRYYEEEELLQLQQILFFRELGFELKQIAKLLGRSDFSKIATLQAHRRVLLKEGDRIRGLMGTIDKTIQHLKGEQTMEHSEMYAGFSPEKQAEYERYITEHCGETGRELTAEAKRRTRSWTRDDWQRVKTEGESFNRQLAELLKAGGKPGDRATQKLVEKHYRWICQFYEPSKEVYIGLGELYVEHPDFQKFYDGYHKGLAPFLREAMHLFAEENIPS